MDARVVSRLLDAQATAQARIEDQAARVVRAELQRFTGWYDEAAVTAIAVRIGQRVMAAQRSSAALTDAYLSRVLSEMLGGPVKPAGVLRITGPLRRGVTDHAQVYSRLGETYRYWRSVGYPDDAALSQAIDRLDAMARMDVELARREQTHETLVLRGEVTGYRRMIRPYLSKGGTCGLCVAASNRVYSTDELMPIHDRCKCIALPVTRLHDPGVTINDADLGELYEAAGSTEAARLKEVRVRVEDHGELGPRLVDVRHRSKTPGLIREARDAAGLDPRRRPDTAERERAYRDLARRARDNAL
ncbi:hypothetical protein ACI3EY_16650 [Ornithinimicrobium sp. LYQ92]|uniref:hypothetical protein n=1 Tax=Serinicoccus sp. LYQ92 TaxID=3378798 RepID=UPI003853C6BB